MHEVTDSDFWGKSGAAPALGLHRGPCVKGRMRPHPAALLGLHIQCSFLTLHSPSDATVGADQPNKRPGAGGELGKPDDAPQNAKTGPQQAIRGWCRVSSPMQSRKQVTFETCSLGGEDAWSSCLAERLRKASRRLRPISSGHAQSPGRGGLAPVPPRPHASPRGPREGPGPPAGPRHPGWAVASCSRPLPGGGAAHRASIRERRGGGGRREEEAGFKRKAVTPHKRFL